jgi:hypothetical protein
MGIFGTVRLNRWPAQALGYGDSLHAVHKVDDRVKNLDENLPQFIHFGVLGLALASSRHRGRMLGEEWQPPTSILGVSRQVGRVTILPTLQAEVA